jgi:hypothetical protein
MECIIRIVDGQPFEHPILMDNFKARFAKVDIDNLPPEFAKFERIEMPRVLAEQNPYCKLGLRYSFDSDMNKWKDDWYLIDLTDDEKLMKRAEEEFLVTNNINILKEFAYKNLESASDERKPIWQAYLDLLNNLTYDDPHNVVWPDIPTI